MSDDILIKIGADSKKFDQEVDKIKEKTASIEDNLQSVATVSGIAFAALVGGATAALAAYAGAEKATNQLTVALQNQGIASKALLDSYKAIASEVQKQTGLDDDAVVAAQARLQNYIGQTKITKELSFAIADLGTKTGDLESAADLLGKAYQGNTAALKKMGIEVDANASAQDRLKQASEEVNRIFGGQAKAANEGLGGIEGLKNAFGNLLEEVGKRLAPAVSDLTKKLTAFFQGLSENGPLLDFIVEAGKIVGILLGAVTAVTGTAIAILKMKQAIEIARVAMNAFGITTKAAVGATGIGLLLIVAAEIYAHWGTIWPAMVAIYEQATKRIGAIGAAIGDILGGAFSFDVKRMGRGLLAIQKQFKEGFEAVAAAIPKDLEAPGLEQDPAKKKAAQKAAKEQAEEDRRARETRTANAELANLESSQASKQQIDLKKQEIEILKALETEKNEAVIGSLRKRLETTRLLEAEAKILNIEQERVFNEELLATNAEYQALSDEQKATFLATSGAGLQEKIDTEATVQKKAAADSLQAQITTQNTFLANQNKFGTAYAEINKIIYNSQVQAAGNSFGELSKLQQSNNSTLKAIGKAAAVTKITIDTAQSAMSIYAGFATIPIIGPVLGVAGAAAAVGFGAEQIGKVLAAKEGGLVTGGRQGYDSVPAMLAPGELVVPSQNFSEVVQAVSNQRQGLSSGSAATSPTNGEGQSQSIQIQFDGPEAEKVLTARRNEARSLGTLREATT